MTTRTKTQTFIHAFANSLAAILLSMAIVATSCVISPAAPPHRFGGEPAGWTTQALTLASSLIRSPLSTRPHAHVVRAFHAEWRGVAAQGGSPWGAAALGLVTGMASALLGIGGGPFVVAVLLGAYGLTAPGASATSSASIVVIAWLSAGTSLAAEPRAVHWPTVIALGSGSLAMVRLLRGKRLKSSTWRSGLLTIIGAIGWLYLAHPSFQWLPASPADTYPVAYSLSILFLGMVLGAAQSLAGIGGGVVAVPVLTTVMGLSFSTARATSLVVIAVTSLYAAWSRRADVKRPIASIVASFGSVGVLLMWVARAWLKAQPWFSDEILKETLGVMLVALAAINLPLHKLPSDTARWRLRAA